MHEYTTLLDHDGSFIGLNQDIKLRATTLVSWILFFHSKS